RRAARAPWARRSGLWTRQRCRRIFVGDDTSEMPCALIVMGVSGSGKSTIGEKLAEQLGWKYEDGDSFHPASNVAKMRAGQHGVIACPALKRAYRDILVHGRKDVRIIFLKGSQELIASRLAQRKGH